MLAGMAAAADLLTQLYHGSASHSGVALTALIAVLAWLMGSVQRSPVWGEHALGWRPLASMLVPALLPIPALVLLAASVDSATKVWQVPSAWSQLLQLSPLGAAFGAGLLLLAVLASLWRRGRAPSLVTVLSLLATPYLFNLLLVLGASNLSAQLGRWVSLGVVSGDTGAALLGRALVLVTVNEALLIGAGLLLDRRWTRPWRVHGLLLLASVLAVASPLIADLGTLPRLVTAPAPLAIAAIVFTIGLAQAALWAQTFLITGVMLDALHGRRPTWLAVFAHWRGGLMRGGVYGGLFMLLVHLIAQVALRPELAAWFVAHPLLGGLLLGPVVFPLAKTVVESFDGSAPFFVRLFAAYREPVNYLRGVIAGVGLGLVLSRQLSAQDAQTRFAAGVAIGAAAYAGADLLHDLYARLRGRRRSLQTWRVYVLGMALGGFVAGALAWYFDSAQLAAVLGKFVSYAAINDAAQGRTVSQYVIYPLFSKWGAMDLGSVGGGAKLLYVESLSGVINWSLAAPLFGFNLVLLTALFKRSIEPVRTLFSGAGMTGVVEQTVRVLRWGLWMAPIIYSFLRLAPEPTWYNQDGAVRTILAIVQDLRLSPADFRDFSLQLFLGLLAYDAVRVLIWFDHMGLRVATLVNLSFVGGDALDEKAARFVGHAARTRIIPEGIRRFLTWAPLLIPFYIPRGADWDLVWGRAEQVAVAGPPLLPQVVTLFAAYQLAGVLFALLAVGLIVLIWRRRGAAAAHAPMVIGNGRYTMELGADGRGYSRMLSEVRADFVLDLTKRPDDALQLRGKFFYLRELDASGAAAAPAWSLTPKPCGDAAAYKVLRATPTTLQLRRSAPGLELDAHISIDAVDPTERWAITLHNTEDRERVIELTSYQELALGPVDDYRRTPPYAGMHVGTTFVRTLGAVIARNRLMRTAERDPTRRRPCNECVFHAVGESDAVVLTGYEDSRSRFLGRGTAAAPALLNGRAPRALDDEGLLYSFDPAASLRVRVTLAPGARQTVQFVDGYAATPAQAAERIARALGRSKPDADALAALHLRHRALLLPEDEHAGADPFSDDGRSLIAPMNVERPWTHVMANALGHGLVAGSDGSLFAFAGNAQQNALTPFDPDSVPTQAPGQVFYVRDVDSDELYAPTQVPLRRADVQHSAHFGLGTARYQAQAADLALQLDAWIAPDAPVQLRRFEVRNTGTTPRKLQLASYSQIVLAETPADSRGALQVLDAEPGCLLFRRADNDFERGWAFVATSLDRPRVLSDRGAFLGAAGDLSRPQALQTTPASHAASGAAADASADGDRAAVFMQDVVLAPGEAFVYTLALGQCAELKAAQQLAARYRDMAAVQASLSQSSEHWDAVLGGLRVQTTRPEIDRLINDWLPYQILTARLWGRTGPNQRSGAWGFRDQLQDVLPLTRLAPQLARDQILLHAAQQFVEGDVPKWWHRAAAGDTGICVRTAASDPHLWLPYVVARYIETSGDAAVLDEDLRYLEARPLPAGQEGVFFAPRPSREHGSLYEHCRRALDWSWQRRGHSGLPLLGSGDWNDGLDAPGLKGKAESVWLGLFLHRVLLDFAAVAKRRGDSAEAEQRTAQAEQLRAPIEAMWQSDHYLRASTDDGSTLDYASALMSAWPALSGAVPSAQARAALESGLTKLERDTRVLLLAPPFDEHSQPYPGRIAEYPPGVRENGGQYSHGASWLVDAYVQLAQQAETAGDAAEARRCRERALALWLKISPLSKADDPAYGLAPHQQPADVYDGEGHAGRGGWSWYTGAAARMLDAMHALLGIEVRDGELHLAPHAGQAIGELKLLRVEYRGVVHTPES